MSPGGPSYLSPSPDNTSSDLSPPAGAGPGSSPVPLSVVVGGTTGGTSRVNTPLVSPIRRRQSQSGDDDGDTGGDDTDTGDEEPERKLWPSAQILTAPPIATPAKASGDAGLGSDEAAGAAVANASGGDDDDDVDLDDEEAKTTSDPQATPVKPTPEVDSEEEVRANGPNLGHVACRMYRYCSTS